MLAALLTTWPWLSTAARCALGRLGSARFVNREAAVAGVIVAALLCLIAAAGWLRAEITAGRDATWKEKLARSRVATLALQRARDQASAEAAAAAREALAIEVEDAIARAAEMERRLAEVAAAAARTGQDPDPVVFPRDLARSLRQ